MSEARDETTGRFQPGHSGNPAGRRKGSKNRATLWAEAIENGDADAVKRAVMARAKDGDAVAQRFVLSRLLPPARERCISLAGLPAPSGWPAQDARAAFHLIRAALVEGEVAPGEAMKLLAFFTRGRAVEDAALEEDWQQEKQEAEAARRRQEEAERLRREAADEKRRRRERKEQRRREAEAAKRQEETAAMMRAAAEAARDAADRAAGPTPIPAESPASMPPRYLPAELQHRYW
jgi:hypothetical protein